MHYAHRSRSAGPKCVLKLSECFGKSLAFDDKVNAYEEHPDAKGVVMIGLFDAERAGRRNLAGLCSRC